MLSSMRFDHTVAAVTGGAHGIGRATVARLASEGARVAVLDIDLEAARETARSCDPAGGRVRALGCDVTSTASVEDAIEQLVFAYGQLDVLAAVAGGDWEGADPLDEQYWDKIIDLNLRGTVRLVRACQSHLEQSSRASIVAVSSVNALTATGGLAYSSAKAGLGILARNLAVALGPKGIRVNVVSPGTVRTRVWDGQAHGADDLRPLHPLGRVGEPEDIAAAIAFLSSADASWITGVTLPVDGGFTAGPLTLMPLLFPDVPSGAAGV